MKTGWRRADGADGPEPFYRAPESILFEVARAKVGLRPLRRKENGICRRESLVAFCQV
jgi:hypothetical protein